MLLHLTPNLFSGRNFSLFPLVLQFAIALNHNKTITSGCILLQIFEVYLLKQLHCSKASNLFISHVHLITIAAAQIVKYIPSLTNAMLYVSLSAA